MCLAASQQIRWQNKEMKETEQVWDKTTPWRNISSRPVHHTNTHMHYVHTDARSHAHLHIHQYIMCLHVLTHASPLKEKHRAQRGRVARRKWFSIKISIWRFVYDLASDIATSPHLIPLTHTSIEYCKISIHQVIYNRYLVKHSKGTFIWNIKHSLASFWSLFTCTSVWPQLH